MKNNLFSIFGTRHDDDLEYDVTPEPLDTPESRHASDYAALSEVPQAFAAFLDYQNSQWR